MLYPTFSEKRLGPTLGLNHLPAKEASEIRSLFFALFKEHNAVMRYKFFLQPLIRFLWKLFIEESPKTLFEYFEWIQNREDKISGMLKLEAIFEEISKIERRTKYKILPDGVGDIIEIGVRGNLHNGRK